MAEAKYAHNHTIDPETGFLENPAYANDFDAQRKKDWLRIFAENGLGFYRTCEKLGVSHSTVNKHYQIDPVFKQLLDQTRIRYGDELEAVSRQNALNPKSVIERIFQLKAHFPEKYADQRNSQANLNISITVDSELLRKAKERSEAIEAEIANEFGTPDLNSKVIDNQPK